MAYGRLAADFALPAPPGEEVFLESGIWEVPAGVTSVDLFLVGAGGGGSASGGGGGYTTTLKNIAVEPSQEWTVIVGSKGLGGVGEAGTNGGQSKFELGEVGYTADGGKASPFTGTFGGGDGGSGGGASDNTENSAGDGGSDGGNGGNNTSNTRPGGIGQGTTTRAFEEETGTLFAAGGGGGQNGTGTAGAGGEGGGGAGGKVPNVGTAAEPSTGSGGGGGRNALDQWAGADGADGIVIVRWGGYTGE